MKPVAICLLTALISLFFGRLDGQTITDNDGNSYNLVDIGTQTWMTSNLKAGKFSNGEVIPQATSSIEWNRARENKQPVWCYLNFDSSTGEKHGKIYNLYAVTDNRGLAPKGYHIPTEEEWNTLTASTGLAGLKSKDGWAEPGNNNSGLSLYPDGYFISVSFEKFGSEGRWWSATHKGRGTGVLWLDKLGSHSVESVPDSWGFGYTVRCLKGEPAAWKAMVPVKAIPASRAGSVIIGTQEWDTKNLNVEKFANGELIPEAKTFEDWVKSIKAQEPAWCHYELNPENDAAYGKLYNWFAVNDARGIALKGWHVPTSEEWDILFSRLGGIESAGLKAKSTNGWDFGNGDDLSGLELTPGGYRNGEGFFDKQGLEGWYWNSSGNALRLAASSKAIQKVSVYNLERGYSVRCINNKVVVPVITAFIDIEFGDSYNKFGFKLDGKIIIKPKYDMAHDFSDGLGLVQLHGKYGFIDSNGSEVIPFNYESADNFFDGLSKVRRDNKYGVIDKTGREIIPLIYDYLPGFLMESGFAEGLIVAGLNGQYGFLDKSGKEVIPFKYTTARSFSDGLATVRVMDKFGFINKKGKEIVPFIYANSESFSQGLAAVFLNEKWGFINQKGKTVIPFIYDKIESFSQGSAIVSINEKWGLVNEAGNVLTPINYERIIRYETEGLRTQLDGYWGNIDYSGRETIPPKYQEEFYFSEGLAAVKYNNKYGFIDNTGKEVIPFIYDDAGGFLSTGAADVEVNGRWFKIDKTGKEVM